MPVNERIKTSPCIGRCSCTLGDEVCVGCGRTFEQVSNWPFYSREKRIKITSELRGRNLELEKSSDEDIPT